MNLSEIFSSILPHMGAVWIVVTVVCGALELIVPSFSFIFASAAALLAFVASFFFGPAFQLIIFSFVLVFSLTLLRRRFVTKLYSGRSIPTRTEALLGKRGLVTEKIDSLTGSGRIMIEGQDWAAQSSSEIAVGKTVRVEGSDGLVLKVKEV